MRNSESCKFKAKITGKTNEIALLLKYLSNFWRTLKLLPKNCEMDLLLT